MSSNGVETTSIQSITDRADVGFGTFYNYFASKDDVAAQVLDCVIHTLGRRIDLANQQAEVADPMQVVANSVRLVAREMMIDPMWHWWVKRPDILVERMRAGFGPFGLRDMDRAVEAGVYRIPAGDTAAAWSFLIWLLAGGIKDIVDDYRPPATEMLIAEAVMRVMGASLDVAEAVSRTRLPSFPSIEIDFTFAATDAKEAA